MTKSRKVYNKDFKDMIVELYNSGKTKDQLCKEYKIGHTSLNRWINERTEISKEDGETISKQEIKRIEKENAKLKQEIEILKKALVLFVPK